MNNQLQKQFVFPLGVAIGLVSASWVQGQDVFLTSYPNANITVDGDASDWNLDQFGIFITGGVAAGGDDFEWEPVDGTGDIARLGWDEGQQDVYYGSKWTGNVLPENFADNSVKFYARDNSTHQYFLVEIIDDEINSNDDAAWANDSVEFYIDPSNDRGESAGGDPAWVSDVQLVIDAGNAVQVWNSPIDYEEQVEAGVESVVTITETGWLLEVGIDKSVFDPPLPAFLGPANDPAGNNYGIDLSYRDNDDPDGTGTRNGDPLYSTNYVWADPNSGGGFPTKIPDNWGQMIAGTVVPGDFNSNGVLDLPDVNLLNVAIAEGGNDLSFDLNADGSVDRADLNFWVVDLKNTWLGDANLNGEFNSGDLVLVFQANKFETNQPAGWEEGDWNADLRFGSGDLVAAFQQSGFEAGPRPASAAVPEPSTAMMSLMALAAFVVAFSPVNRRR